LLQGPAEAPLLPSILLEQSDCTNPVHSHSSHTLLSTKRAADISFFHSVKGGLPIAFRRSIPQTYWILEVP
jgi:hypothetical protein